MYSIIKYVQLKNKFIGMYRIQISEIQTERDVAGYLPEYTTKTGTRDG